MTTEQLIAKFELYVDDLTELSSAEELDLANKIYHEICGDRPWEFLRKQSTGIMTDTTTIPVPTRFRHFLDTGNRTDNSQDDDVNAGPRFVWINGTKKLLVINFGDRRQYTNRDGYVYYDAGTGVIKTTYAQPAGATYDFDFKQAPEDLTLITSPVFPTEFHMIIAHGMAADDMIIQLFEKARGYRQENLNAVAGYFGRLCSWNANIRND